MSAKPTASLPRHLPPRRGRLDRISTLDAVIYRQQRQAAERKIVQAETAKAIVSVASSMSLPTAFPDAASVKRKQQSTPPVKRPRRSRSKLPNLPFSRSELRRVISLQLAKNRSATDLEIIRALDADGEVEFPSKWKENNQNRSFESAYRKDKQIRGRLQSTFSKVRSVMRKLGQL